MTASLASESLGDIAVRLPGASAVFRKHGLDFCCGGRAVLADAVREHGVDLDAVTAELQALDSGAKSDHPHEAAALIDHILERYHAVHRRELPELIRLAEKVERVHASHPQVPAGLASLLWRMSEDLETHMKKEEAVLFPMMRQPRRPIIAHPIARMRIEHDDHGAHLRALEAITRGHEAPAEACGSWRALYAGTRKLTDDLMQHIHLENNVLFPQFATDLPTTPICPGMLAEG